MGDYVGEKWANIQNVQTSGQTAYFVFIFYYDYLFAQHYFAGHQHYVVYMMSCVVDLVQSVYKHAIMHPTPCQLTVKWLSKEDYIR